MKSKAKKCTRLCAALVLGAVLLSLVIYGIPWVLMPLRTNYGCMWDMYRNEPENSIDAIFFGSSMVYCDVVPATIWEDSGLRTYVMAGPEQTMPITYYYVKEACRTQSPQAIIVEVTGLCFPKYTNYTKANIGYMPWGFNRLLATANGAEAEEIAGLMFPVFNYHDLLWGTLDGGSLKAIYNKKMNRGTDPLAGFTMMEDSKPQSELVYKISPSDDDTYKENLDYLGKIAQFCAANDIQLVLYNAPAYTRITEEAHTMMKKDFESIPHALYFDGNELNFEQYDPELDWHDTRHTNLTGAKKFSSEFAKQLTSLNLIVTDREHELWQSRVDALPTD